MKRFLSIIMIVLTTSAVAGVQLQKARFAQLPGWYQGKQGAAIGAIKASCERELFLVRYRSPRYDVRATSAYKIVCRKVIQSSGTMSNSRARSFLIQNFTPYLVTNNGNPIGLFTGYYAPTIPGSLRKTKYYKVPLYAKPSNLVRVKINGRYRYRLKTKTGYKMLPTRRQISSGPVLANAPVLLWIHSKVDRFFLQIQGSGSVTLQNGKRILLGYSGQTGYKYYPIGRYLVKSGKIPMAKISMQPIKAWLKSNPSQAQRVMNMNPSFVFFRKLNTQQPIGAEGIALTPKHSLAVDTKLIPLGLPLWLSTYYPKHVKDNSIQPGKPLNQLMVAQDTGGAIRGAVRGDIFWGAGKQAEWLAGHMQFKGRYWILLPKGASPALLNT